MDKENAHNVPETVFPLMLFFEDLLCAAQSCQQKFISTHRVRKEKKPAQPLIPKPEQSDDTGFRILLQELDCSGLYTIRDGLMGVIFFQNAIFNHFVDRL